MSTPVSMSKAILFPIRVTRKENRHFRNQYWPDFTFDYKQRTKEEGSPYLVTITSVRGCFFRIIARASESMINHARNSLRKWYEINFDCKRNPDCTLNPYRKLSWKLCPRVNSISDNLELNRPSWSRAVHALPSSIRTIFTYALSASRRSAGRICRKVRRALVLNIQK